MYPRPGHQLNAPTSALFGGCSTPDYLTPQEQLFRMDYEPSSMQLDDEVSRWDYHQEVELGHGNFSKVYRAVHRLTGVAFAVKTNRSPITTLQARNMWLNEMQALAAVQHHPNIVGLYDAWFEPDVRGDAEQAYLKLELCGDSLGGAFKRRMLMKEQDVLDMLRQMASALKRIHELGMVHLDVKPDNIYMAVGHSLGSGGGGVYKLGDFGLAVVQGGQRAGTSEGDSKYLAPEALKSRDFLNSGLADRLDIFALGASAYELLRGSELPKNGQPYHDIRAGKIFLPGSNQRLVALLKKMMAPDPAQRPTAEQLLKSSLLNTAAGAGHSQPNPSTPQPLSQ
ncbi:hypothetical protein PLESTF_001901400 [Pleodorina starrii]|nr:hypothetical protein PLESTF_001901400 [Pleodorina starrii]